MFLFKSILPHRGVFKPEFTFSLIAVFLIGTSGQAQLTVTVTANPANVVWGHGSEVTAIASGGVAPYNYAWNITCAGAPVPTIWYTSLEDPTNIVSGCFERTGAHVFYSRVIDSVGTEVVASATVQVLEPNKIVPLQPQFSGNVTFDGNQVTVDFTVLFEVRNNTQAVDSCANACTQSKIWANPPATEASTPWNPGVCTTFSVDWGPPTIDLMMGFSVPLAEWSAAEELEIVATKYCRVKFNYEECNGTDKELSSGVYRVDFKKVSHTQGTVTFTRA